MDEGKPTDGSPQHSQAGNMPPSPSDRILKHFECGHLPPHLQAVSKPFGDLAHHIYTTLQSGPERSVALRKLLEGKDAAVRAKIHPGG